MIMSEQDFQTEVLLELKKLNGRFDSLEGKIDRIQSDLTDFKENQEAFNNGIWNLNTQAFQAINDVRSEVVSPWKLRQSKTL
jgi:predicted  nucleic acid-binding Zn-ribbon protein